MKKILCLLLSILLVATLFVFTGCGDANEPEKTDDQGEEQNPDDTPDKPDDGEKEDEPADATFDYDAISDTAESADGTYELAFVTDVGQLKDKSFNQGTWEGVKRFATENGKTYKYYMPANGANATDTDRYDAMKAACDAGAKVVVCAGFMQGTALCQVAAEYPDVKFVFIDGSICNDADGNALNNVAAVIFHEEQSGYFAGYAAVMEGYTKLGFSGGGGGSNPACCRFGYGFIQGASAAAAKKGVDVEMKYSWEYGSTFSDSAELTTMLQGWYSTGTEVVFSCGGSMCKSAFSAAGDNDAFVIGVDVDQSAESETVITSATKGLREAVLVVVGKFYEDKWAEVGGVETNLGVAEDAVGLPTASWKLKNFSVDDYNALFADVKAGTLTIDADYNGYETKTYDHLTLNVQ